MSILKRADLGDSWYWARARIRPREVFECIYCKRVLLVITILCEDDLFVWRDEWPDINRSDVLTLIDAFLGERLAQHNHN
jgi:hypothetical protein